MLISQWHADWYSGAFAGIVWTMVRDYTTSRAGVGIRKRQAQDRNLRRVRVMVDFVDVKGGAVY